MLAPWSHLGWKKYVTSASTQGFRSSSSSGVRLVRMGCGDQRGLMVASWGQESGGNFLRRSVVMSRKRYAWELGNDLPEIDEHSIAKHHVLRSYLIRYVEVL